ncbi:MAG: phytoene desaturase family protein [Tepidisphaeraceae bacterium]
MPESRVVIIGGGLGGLAAAVRSAASGRRVTLLEAGPRVGGKLNRWTAAHPARPGDRPFTFDTGPSLLTLPLALADLFSAAGRDIRNYLPIQRLDPVCRFVWADGQAVELRANRRELLAEIRRFAPGDEAGFVNFLDFGKKVWDLSGDLFLSQSPEQALRGDGTFSPRRALDMLTVPVRIGMFAKFAARVDRHVKSPRLREILYQYATYSGASPFKAPATLAVIPHVELDQGGFYVPGGLYRIAEAVETLAKEIGVTIRTNCPAARILVDGNSNAKKVSGVMTAAGETLPAEAVIVNADVMSAYRELIAPEDRPSWPDGRLAKVEPGGSGMVLLLGVEGTYPRLAHHTKFMPADYRSDLTAMFETRTVPADPCIYVCASTRSDPTQAPDGCENLFVLCSAPPLDGTIDWAVEGPRYRDQIVRTLEHRFGLSDLSKRIVVERRITPADLQSLYNANAGSIYGISSNGVRQAFLRPPNKDKDVRGLFFAGGATHPGGGLPLVTLSGKIAASLAEEYLATDGHG